MALLSGDGWLFLLRWFHFLAGITWIGMLYYFNFVQTPFFATAEAPVRMGQLGGPREFLAQPYGLTILIGGLLGTTMWFNVWFIIWPAQQVVMASATQVKGGGQAIPEAAARGQRGGFASRTNTMLSIPMLFFMGAAKHLTMAEPTSRGGKIGSLILLLVVMAD